MEVLGFPNGTCTVEGHGPKLSVNGESVCMKCKAAAERALRTHIPVVTVQDPGKDAFDAQGRLRPGHVQQEGPVVQTVAVNNTAQAGQQIDKRYIGETPRSKLAIIREAIYGLPMPKSIKQYKRFQKIQALIDEALSEEENG